MIALLADRGPINALAALGIGVLFFGIAWLCEKLRDWWWYR